MVFPQCPFSRLPAHPLAADSVRRKPRNIVRPCRAYPDVLITARKGLLDENAFDLLRIEEGFLALSGMTGGEGPEEMDREEFGWCSRVEGRNWREEKASPLPTKSPRGRGRRDKFRGKLQVGSGQRGEGRERGRPLLRPACGGQVGVPFDSAQGKPVLHSSDIDEAMGSG